MIIVQLCLEVNRVVDVDVVTLPYAGTTLTGYLVRPEEAAAKPYPTVVTVAGYDSPIEEFYALNVVGWHEARLCRAHGGRARSRIEAGTTRSSMTG